MYSLGPGEPTGDCSNGMVPDNLDQLMPVDGNEGHIDYVSGADGSIFCDQPCLLGQQ